MPRRNRAAAQTVRHPDRGTAWQRQIFAVRRGLAPSSHESLQELPDALLETVHGLAKVFTLESLSATVISLSRFDQRHIAKGPPTEVISRQVESSRYELSAKIGAIAIFGSQQKAQLAFKLNSLDLVEEEAHYCSVFEAYGFPLQSDINSDDGQYHPHLSVTLISSDYIGFYKQAQVIAELNQDSALSNFIGTDIMLSPHKKS